MPDEIVVQPVDRRQGELQHHVLIRRERVELLGDERAERRFGLTFARVVDRDLRFDDRDEPGRDDLAGDVELLLDHERDRRCVPHVDDRAHLRAEHLLRRGVHEQRRQVRNRLHEPDARRRSSARPTSIFTNGTIPFTFQR